jgi:hypothetical protein
VATFTKLPFWQTLVFPEKNTQKYFSEIGTEVALYIDIRKRELKMRKFSSYSSSYRPYGSDDGYDYHKDNRYGEVDDYVRFVKEWRKKQAEEKDKTPKSGD